MKKKQTFSDAHFTMYNTVDITLMDVTKVAQINPYDS